MGDYSTIKSKLSTVLSGVSGIKNVYAYNKGQLEGYPSAVFAGVRLDDQYLDTYNNVREWTFDIKVYQEMEASGIGASNAESYLDTLFDSIVDTIDKNYTLDGTVDAVWISGANAFEDRELSMRVLDLQIKVKKSFSIIT